MTEENSDIAIKIESDSERLDSKISELLSAELLEPVSRSYVAKLIKADRVSVNGLSCKAGQKLKKGDRVCVTLAEKEELSALPEDIPLDIVYQDSFIAVINKPVGMVVHPAAGNPSGTLVNAALFHIKDLSGIGGVIRPGIVHRIDKMTAGLIVIAKNDMAHISLSAQIKEHSAKRRYLALVASNIKEDTLTIDAPIGRCPGDRKKMAVIKDGRGVAKNAVTHITVLKRFGDMTLVKAELETGRTHQIRVHMAYIKHPLVGDNVYSGGNNSLGFKGQALFAYELELVHPSTGEKMIFNAPMPDFFYNALKNIGMEESELAIWR